MDRNTVLIVIDADCSDTHLRALISSVPDNGVHLSFLVVGAVETMPLWAYSSAPYGPVIYPEDWQETFQTMGQRVAEKADEVEQMLLRANVEGDVRSVFSEASLLDEAVAVQAALSDIVLIDPALTPKNRVFENALRGALFQSPVGVVLNARGISSVLAARHPFIAWNTSQPAVRAVHRALPILRQAEQVTIGLFDPEARSYADGDNPGADLATWLSRHGCRVTVQQYPSGGLEIGKCILERTAETGADLIVMGAYSHSRAREQLLGGTTQTLIKQTEQPVLFAH